MNIVPIRHSHRSLNRVEPVQRRQSAQLRSQQSASVEKSFERQTIIQPAEIFAGHSHIAAQVIASRSLPHCGYLPDMAGHLAAEMAYVDALDRKQVRMKAGSFAMEAA